MSESGIVDSTFSFDRASSSEFPPLLLALFPESLLLLVLLLLLPLPLPLFASPLSLIHI